MSSKEVNDVIAVLEDLGKDSTVPKNVKDKVLEVIGILKEESEFSIKVNKALNELDEVTDDSNMQPYTRTQLFNIVTMLESLAS